MATRDLLIVGAGPSGLSAAIAAKRRGLDYQVLEQGTLVNSIYRFPSQMVFFTTPELLEIGGLPFVSPFEKPTRMEALRYYRRVVDTFDLQIAYGETVLAVSPRGRESTLEAEGVRSRSSAGGGAPANKEKLISSEDAGCFAVETRNSSGVQRVREARHVILAIGYFDQPNMLGVPGEDLPHVHHFYDESHPFYKQRVVIVGGGNSAAETALELYRAGAHVTLVHRDAQLKSTIKYWVRPDIENRIKEGSIAAHFRTTIKEIHPTFITVTDADHAEQQLAADAVFLLVGYHADWDLMARAGIQMNERRVPCFDPNTFETNVPGLFLAGGALAGMETGNIFIENGRFHGEKIVEVIAQRG